jgi:hypothetical protein
MKAPFIVPIPKDDLLARVNYMQGKKYYLAFETNYEKAYSVYFPDLVWLKNVFGNELENLNEGRLNEIKHLKECIEYNIPMWELDTLKNITEENKKLLKEKGYILRSNQRKNYGAELVEYRPHKLSEHGHKQFQENIDRGLLVLCELDYYAVGSEFVSGHGWGDVDGVYDTSDNQKAIYTITDIIGDKVMYSISYQDNSTPNKIHTQTIDEFKEAMKPIGIDQWLYRDLQIDHKKN